MHIADRPLRYHAASAMVTVLASLALTGTAQAAPQTTRMATPVTACEPLYVEETPLVEDRRATKLMLQVNAKGVVTDARITQSSRSTPLDEATLEAATNCRFHPALKMGKPVPAQVPFSYAWDEYMVVQAPPPPRVAPAVSPMVDFNTCEKPVYPKSSIRNEETGMVTMSFLIGTDGTVKDKRINNSSGFPALDESALTALAKCRFKPAMRELQVIESWVRIQYVWTLE